MIRALLFDLDGTLFDTTEANVRAYSQTFEAEGLAFNENKYRELFGLRFPEMMQIVAPTATEQQLQQIRVRKPEFYRKAFDFIIPNIGLITLLESAHPSFKTALVTTASSINVSSLLTHFKLGEAEFDTIITGEHVRNSKPDPECYLQAAERLGIAVADCCVFEDSDVGIEAAIRSGAQVIRVRF